MTCIANHHASLCSIAIRQLAIAKATVPAARWAAESPHGIPLDRIFAALASIIVIDLAGGRQRGVIALAARNVPSAPARRAILWGKSR
jgi:hypothetical protein